MTQETLESSGARASDFTSRKPPAECPLNGRGVGCTGPDSRAKQEEASDCTRNSSPHKKNHKETLLGSKNKSWPQQDRASQKKQRRKTKRSASTWEQDCRGESCTLKETGPLFPPSAAQSTSCSLSCELETPHLPFVQALE